MNKKFKTLDKKFIAALILLFLFILACGKSKKDDTKKEREYTKQESQKSPGDEKAKEEEDEKDKLRLVFGSPYLIPNSPFVLVPLILTDIPRDTREDTRQESERYSQFDDLKDYYTENFRDFRHDNMYNVVYYNSRDRSSYTLLTRKALINKFYLPSRPDADTALGRFVIFTLIEEDYNLDGKLTREDGETVYKCTIYGQNITQISPRQIKLLNWDADVKNDAIYLQFTADTDGNKKFNQQDESQVIRTSITSSGIGTPIISDSLKNSMNSLYLK